jgi:large subunit ribosomal protein L1
MKKEDIKKTIEELKKNSTKRNFKQTYDLILIYKGINVKKPDQQLDFYIQLHNGLGKEIKVCALVGPELLENAKQNCTKTISLEEFEEYARDKKLLKKLARDHDYFVAQATIMPKIATVFGKVLGPRAKMPNPKAGCVVPPNANLKPLVAKLQKTVRIAAKTAAMTQLAIGTEDMNEEELIDNIHTVCEQVLAHLPGGINQMKGIYLKLTMSKPIKLVF